MRTAALGWQPLIAAQGAANSDLLLKPSGEQGKEPSVLLLTLQAPYVEFCLRLTSLTKKQQRWFLFSNLIKAFCSLPREA